MTDDGTGREASDWLADAVIYEIYPQSFADSNGDGIGDFPGVLAHLDYLQWLGIDTIWFNPCFASPFVDAGYDVSDYLTVAPRYGTNEDLIAVVDGARKRGIRVVLDLVAGHTSIEHEWFQAELHAEGPDPLGDRYIWTTTPDDQLKSLGGPGHSPWVPSPGPRPGYYLKNFYDEQPALNFGYATQRPDAPWRDAVDAPGPVRNRQALRDIMAFWLDRGIAGFRVDMAFSLVKDDEGYVETVALWRDLRDWLAQAYPSAVIIPEGSEPLVEGIAPAFDADFFLVILAAHAALFNNGGAGRLFFVDPAPPFFGAAGQGTTAPFLQEWARTRSAHPDRAVLLASADHDFSRMATGDRSMEQLAVAFAFLLTWGSVPSIYYGDEIGLRFQPGLPDVEGSEINADYYNRAGVRTPMQWDGSVNAGFSTAPAADLYLPIDPSPDRETVAAQADQPDSLLNTIRALIALRRAHPALGGRAETTVLEAGYPFTYRRGESHIVVVNPREAAASVEVPDVQLEALMTHGCSASGGLVQVDGFGYGVFAIAAPDARA